MMNVKKDKLEKSNIFIKDVKKINHTRCGPLNVVYFKPPINRIIVGGGDGFDVIDSCNNIIVKSFTSDGGYYDVQALINWTDNTFLHSTSDQKIICYSAKDTKEIYSISFLGVSVEGPKKKMNSMLKLKDDVLITYIDQSKALVIWNKFSEGKVERIIRIPHQATWLKTLVRSLGFEDCFYFNNDDKFKVELYNISVENAIKKYDVHALKKQYILAVSCYLNHMKEEIVLIGGNESILYSYDAKSGVILRTVRINKQGTFYAIYSIHVLSNKLFCVGDGQGKIFMIDENFEIAMSSYFPKPAWVMDFATVEVSSHEVKLLACSRSVGKGDGVMSLNLAVPDINILEEFQDEDLLERVLFFKSDKELYYFCEEDIKRYHINLLLKNLELMGIPKILFC